MGRVILAVTPGRWVCFDGVHGPCAVSGDAGGGLGGALE